MCIRDRLHTTCVMQDFKIKLNGYSTEFVCMMKQKHLKDGSISDPNSEAELDFETGVDGCPQLKLLKDNANGSLSYLKPFVTDEISAFDTYPMVLTQGTYIIPFSFELDPIKHHSSFRSLFGSTTYRVETLLRVMQPSKGIISGIPTDSGDSKNYFLSQKCFITKTLSPSDVLKYESVNSHGTFQNGLIDYGFYISTKLIEFDSPFHCHFNCIGKPDIKIIKVNVSLLQTCILPCIKPDGIAAAKRSYSNTNTFRLAEYVVPPDEQSNIITTKFEDLKIATRSSCNLFTSKILPYYNEVSRLETVDGEKVMKLSITHRLKIVVTINPSGSDSSSKNFINVNFKIPIEVIDKNISSSLYLPAYKSPSPAISGNGPFTIDEDEYNSYSSPISLSSADSPPAYSGLCH